MPEFTTNLGRKILYLLVGSIVIPVAVIAILVLWQPLWRAALFDLFARSWSNTLTATSQTNLSVCLYSVAVPVIAFITSVYFHSGEGMMARIRDSILPTLVSFLVPLCLVSIVFGLQVAHTAYTDHQQAQNLTANINSVKQERDEFKTERDNLRRQNGDLDKQLKEKPKEMIRTVAGPAPATIPASVPEEPLRLKAWNYPGMHPIGNAPDAKTSTWIIVVANKKLEAPVSFVFDYIGDIAMSRAVATPMVGNGITMGGATILPGNKIVVNVQSPSVNACVPIMMNIESKGAEVRVSSIQLAKE